MAAKSSSYTRAKRFLIDYAGFLTSCGLPTRSSDFDRLPLNKATQLKRKVAEHFRSEVMTARPDLHDAEVMKRRIALVENVTLRQILSAQLVYQPAPIAMAFQAFLERVGTNLASRFTPRLTACDTKKNSRRQIREFVLGLADFDASLPWYRELASIEDTDLHDIVERALYERLRASDWRTRIAFVITSVFDALPQQSERIVSALMPGPTPTPADVDVIEDRIIHAAGSKPDGEYTLFAVCAGIGWDSLANKCQTSALGAQPATVEGSSRDSNPQARPADEVTTTSFLVRDYRDFLDDYSIHTTAADFRDWRGLANSEQAEKLASHFLKVTALPTKVDWTAEVATLPESSLRDALTSGLAQRSREQGWWDQATNDDSTPDVGHDQPNTDEQPLPEDEPKGSHEFVRPRSWIEQARFVITTVFGDSTNATHRMLALAAAARDGKITDKARFYAELRRFVEPDVRLRGELQEQCRRVGWTGIASTLDARNPPKDPNLPTFMAAPPRPRPDSVPKSETTQVTTIANPCAVVILSPEVRAQVKSQFHAPDTDIRLDFPTHFLTEKLSIHRHWRLYLGSPIAVKTLGTGKHNVVTIDVQITGHHIDIDMLNENGARCNTPGSHIDYLGLPRDRQLKDRYTEPFRRLAIIALIHVFGDSNLMFPTRTKAKLKTAKHVVGWKLTAAQVYSVNRIIDTAHARRFASRWTDSRDLVAPSSSKCRKRHPVRGHKRRQPDGSFSLIPAHQRGGRKRK